MKVNRYFENCKRCSGKGYVMFLSQPEYEEIRQECGECEAIGYHLTEDGQELICFLNRINYGG